MPSRPNSAAILSRARKPVGPIDDRSRLAAQQAMSEAIIAEQHSGKYPNAHGVTIELSNQSGRAKGPGAPGFSAAENGQLERFRGRVARSRCRGRYKSRAL